MPSLIVNVLFIAVLASTLVCATDWLFRSVLHLRSKRPWRAASSTLALCLLTVGPSVYGVDALVGHDLSGTSRALLWLCIGVLQTGLVVRLMFGGSVPLALAHGLILQLTWGAVSVLVLLCDRLGGFYFALPLALILGASIARQTQDRELVRRLSSVPPSAPPVRADGPTVGAA
ncbi:MAG: hypothetical protein KC593_20720 [Myxococcales bacterium]|nr:hypothetical protein [Myxococcales bacterium]MCB9627412.1 hypothetical protein [Sandaracinaceae bacterium]